ncbi:MAG: hypothetical protein MUE95_10945, partial [Cyclobacteriaceae bacterium]|nr:hypothetical protein [Cyclobacteriaceae bacterium]
YVTTRLGSAINSNAIIQDNYLFTTTWYFGKRSDFRTLARFNMGYFVADYEDPMFDALENTSFLLSPEFGFAWRSKSPLKIMATVGYNLISGNGEEGAGSLYPGISLNNETPDHPLPRADVGRLHTGSRHHRHHAR